MTYLEMALGLAVSIKDVVKSTPHKKNQLLINMCDLCSSAVRRVSERLELHRTGDVNIRVLYLLQSLVSAMTVFSRVAAKLAGC